ncbi:hypothetical protein JW823_05440 [bacterium]|nr:hypothetical protein [candidate division CSSED10-310 bacterium]
MSNCRRIEKALAAGHFDETLSKISSELCEHMEHCAQCRDAYASLLATEQMVTGESPIELNLTARARIRIGVFNKLERKSLAAGWRGFKPVWGFIATGVLSFLLVLHPWSRQISDPTDPFAVNDTELVDMMFDYIDVPITYDEDLELAVIQQSDPELMAAAIESWYWPSLNEYDETILNSISDFDDSDWDALRRYLI